MADRTQVGLTADAEAKLLELKEDSPYFREEADVYRLGVAVALEMGSAVTQQLREQPIKTKWRVTMEEATDSARLESNEGELARLISLIQPDFADEPYRNSQYLAIIGINYLHQEIIERGSNLHQALQAASEKRAGEG